MSEIPRLEIRYIPLSQARDWEWERNPKLHDLDALQGSIRKYGFRDAPIFDATLGRIVGGNGRVAALTLMSRRQGEEPPRGIAVDKEGEWHIPIQFGIDAVSQEMAESFAVDHNNLTLGGSSLSAVEIGFLYDGSYPALLQRLSAEGELPISLSEKDLEEIGRASRNLQGFERPDGAGKPRDEDYWPVMLLRLRLPPAFYEKFRLLLDQAEGDDESAKFFHLLKPLVDGMKKKRKKKAK